MAMILHHPAPDILAQYAAGTLHAGAALVVACHLEGCAVCRGETELWEHVGGAFLDDIAPTALSQGVLERMMARLDEPARAPHVPVVPDFLRDFQLPQALKAAPIGRRRRVTPGIWFAPITMPGEGASRTYLVHAVRDMALAEHSHRGREFTHVIAGAFADTSGRYGHGDFALTDETVTHNPTVTAQADCLCLISADGPMRLSGLAARVIQALTGNRY
jgi:putative transcriptional regulator